MAKVSVTDIISIRKGRSRTFLMESANECHSVVALVGYVKKVKKPHCVENYKTSTDWMSCAVTVTAL